MKTQTNQNQIVINTDTENEKKMLPVKMLFTLAAGAIAGVAIIFGLFWAVEKLLGM
ncbi:hypothetical protein [Maribellus sp. YY47]|uniref:hypothetical protein n=1 Tax=Maribellus sp. YY47 TaxID=2929486 RepID=UPI002001235A|nr:hypothetical protein [Maribellus sp. YY47]MCK3686139.1 hypothetical protein [Maribellus sp. YY47]